MKKEVCLLLNIGGFEFRMAENLQIAKSYGQTVYSLTGEGLASIDDAILVPVNVIKLSTAELLIWSSIINEQLLQRGYNHQDVVIFAAGKNYRGIVPLGMTIGKGIQIGA